MPVLRININGRYYDITCEKNKENDMNTSDYNAESKVNIESQKHSFIGKPFKDQLEQLDKLIEVTKSGTDTEIETDQENLIAIAPMKAMQAKLKCSISKSETKTWYSSFILHLACNFIY